MLKDGLVISDLEGLNAGVDPVSGDFSLKAAGFLVQGGAFDAAGIQYHRCG